MKYLCNPSGPSLGFQKKHTAQYANNRPASATSIGWVALAAELVLVAEAAVDVPDVGVEVDVPDVGVEVEAIDADEIAHASTEDPDLNAPIAQFSSSITGDRIALI